MTNPAPPRPGILPNLMLAATQAAALQNAPSAPAAAAAVLGQTGLWGSLMGARDNMKTVEEETESTDGEDEVRT